ncbi:MAG TPA: hypothetical protein VG295_01425, partial [Solirubrobacteraceae bacterium]|nr:hypothetical protein [Solirubrobacteraceae bacterium]
MSRTVVFLVSEKAAEIQRAAVVIDGGGDSGIECPSGAGELETEGKSVLRYRLVTIGLVMTGFLALTSAASAVTLGNT